MGGGGGRCVCVCVCVVVDIATASVVVVFFLFKSALLSQATFVGVKGGSRRGTMPSLNCDNNDLILSLSLSLSLSLCVSLSACLFPPSSECHYLTPHSHTFLPLPSSLPDRTF